MLLALRALLVIGVALVTALVASLGLSPEVAEAPTTFVPSLLEVALPTSTPTAPAVVPTIEPPVVATPPQKINAPLPTPAPDLQASSSPPTPPLSLNTTVRAAVVNIVCTTVSGGLLSPISASGVIIDPRGIVLTNAHVAQYFLLKDYPSPNFVECVIRMGSPARPMYTATLLFIPPSWVVTNASKIAQSEPTGTGEHDYALLVITGVTGPGVTPLQTFPFLPIATAAPAVGAKTLIAGYPAGFLGGITVQKDLYASSAEANVGTLYTFSDNIVDLFSVGGTILSQRGSSGGAVADGSGNLVGLIVTATDAPDTAGRDLRALTTSYIIRNFAIESGTSLAAFLGGDILAQAASFNSLTAPTLTKKLTDVLNR